MSSDVTGVRSEMENLIGSGKVTISDGKLLDWIHRLRRKKSISNRKASRSMSMVIADQIRRLDKEALSQSQIAARLKINNGRVSEVLTGAKWQGSDEATS